MQQSAKIEQGRVYLPAETPWLPAVEVEIAQFPHASTTARSTACPRYCGSWTTSRSRW